MAYIGIDLHTNRFTCNFLQQDNSMITYTFNISENGLKNFFLKISKEDYVVIEASTNTFAFYDLIKEKVKEIFIVDPLECQIINRTSKKTDKVDSKKLAKMLKYHVKFDDTFLPLVYVPCQDIRKLRSLFTTYKLYKKQITSIRNRVHSILKQSLNPYNNKDITSKKEKKKILDLELEEEYKIQINLLYETLNHLEEKAEQIKDEILYAGRGYKEEIEILTSVHGISVFIAIGLISDYAEIGRFKNAKRFSSYLRAVPRVKASNDTVHIGKTNKKGRKLSISLLLQSLNHFRTINPGIDKFYKNKKKGKSTGKVRMAVTRKMFVSIYYMLREKKYYKYRIEETHQRKMEEYNRFLKKCEGMKKTA